MPNPRFLFFKRKGASVPQGPRDGRTHCGPSWAGHPKGESPSCSAQPCRPRRGNSGLGRGLPKSLDAADSGPEQRAAPEASPLQGAAPPRLPPEAWTARPVAPQSRSARLAPRSPSPQRWGWLGRGLRRQWERGGRDSCAPRTDRLARAHPVRGGGFRSPRPRREAETGHPVLDLPVSWLPWEHFVPAKEVTVLMGEGTATVSGREGDFWGVTVLQPGRGSDLTRPVPRGLLITVSHAAGPKRCLDLFPRVRDTTRADFRAQPVSGRDGVGDLDLSGLGEGARDWIESPGSGSQMNLLSAASPPLPDPSAYSGCSAKPRVSRARSPPSLIPAGLQGEGRVPADPSYSRPSPRPECPTHPDFHGTRTARHTHGSKTETQVQIHARHSPGHSAHAHTLADIHTYAQAWAQTRTSSAQLPAASPGLAATAPSPLSVSVSRGIRAGPWNFRPPTAAAARSHLSWCLPAPPL